MLTMVGGLGQRFEVMHLYTLHKIVICCVVDVPGCCSAVTEAVVGSSIYINGLDIGYCEQSSSMSNYETYLA